MNPHDHDQEPLEPADTVVQRLRLASVVSGIAAAFFGGFILLAIPLFWLILFVGLDGKSGPVLVLAVSAVIMVIYSARGLFKRSGDSGERLGLLIGFTAFLGTWAYSYSTWQGFG